MSTSKKIGKFVISNALIDEPSSEAALLKIMSKMIVVRAEQRWDLGGIEYIALSDLFDKVQDGYGFVVPSYEITFNNGSITAKKLKY
jgi:hypothetical protein